MRRNRAEVLAEVPVVVHDVLRVGPPAPAVVAESPGVLDPSHQWPSRSTSTSRGEVKRRSASRRTGWLTAVLQRSTQLVTDSGSEQSCDALRSSQRLRRCAPDGARLVTPPVASRAPAELLARQQGSRLRRHCFLINSASENFCSELLDPPFVATREAAIAAARERRRFKRSATTREKSPAPLQRSGP